MKILNVSGAPLTGAVVALAQRLLKYGKRCGAVPGADGVLYTLIVKGDQVLVVNGQAFCIVSADGNTVRWKGGTPPFTVAVQAGDLPGTFVNVDEDIYTVYSEREFTVYPASGPETGEDLPTWWAADDEGNTQQSVGVIIQDSSNPPKNLYAPFGGVSGVYTHFGPYTFCTPRIVWTNPAPISKSTPLSTTQLNAVVYVPGTSDPLPGTYEYSPSFGSVLPQGANTLLVTFTALDSAHYRPAVKAVTLTVVNTAPVLNQVAVTVYGADGSVSTATIYTVGATSTIYCKTGDRLHFAATATDPDGDLLACPWQMSDADGPVGWVGTSLENDFTFEDPGVFNWSTVATDGEYTTPAIYGTVNVTNRLAVAQFTMSPAVPALGDLVTLTDTSTPDLDGDEYSVRWVCLFPSGATTANPETGGPGLVSTFYATATGRYAIQMQVTDTVHGGTSLRNKIFNIGLQSQTIFFYYFTPMAGVGLQWFSSYEGEGTGEVTFTSSNPSVLTVTYSGSRAAGNQWGVSTNAGVYGWATITMHKEADSVYDSATYSVNIQVVASPLSVTILNGGTGPAHVTGGTPPYYATITPAGSIGGSSGNQWYWQNSSNYIVASTGCHCQGSGIMFSDATGQQVFKPFTSLWGPPGICTQGCPTPNAEWEIIWSTSHLYYTGSYNDISAIPGTNCAEDSVYADYGQIRDIVESPDGTYQVEYFYVSGATVPDFNAYPGNTFAEMNAFVGSNFTPQSFEFCSNYSVWNNTGTIRLTRLWRKVYS